MSKKITSLIFSVLLIFVLITLTACEPGDDNTEIKNEIFYISRDDKMIDFETYDLSATGTEDKVLEVMELLKQQPGDRKLKSVFNAGFQVVDIRVENDLTTLVMSREYRQLKPSVEVLTRAAIVKSLCEIEEISHVSMQLEDGDLTDAYGNPVGIMEASMFLYNSGSEINTYEKTSINLYFTDTTGTRLKMVTRNMTYNTNISLERLVVEQIIKGPYTGEVYPTVNPDTRVLGVTVRDGICYVNLDEAFLIQNVNSTAQTTIYSIANSLAELSNVNKIQISVNGENEVMFRDTISLATVFERNLELLE